jgi:hypothetical protein
VLLPLCGKVSFTFFVSRVVSNISTWMSYDDARSKRPKFAALMKKAACT